MKIVYHPKLIFGSRFLARFHPFEFDRANIALGTIKAELGSRADDLLLIPDSPLTLEDLELVHTPEYLTSLGRTLVLAMIIELPILGLCPRPWMRKWFIQPALWSTASSLLAARSALESGCGLCLGGGFHHAKPDRGEGFCFVNDIAYIIARLRQDGTLDSDDDIFYVDLDVHQGNGVSDFFQEDPKVTILDVFNRDIYPVFGGDISSSVEFSVPLASGCEDEHYLSSVYEGLEKLFACGKTPRLVIYNAGSDIFKDDLLGEMNVSKLGVNRRDEMMLQMAHKHQVPILILASGGYSKTSAVLLSDLALSAVGIWDRP